MVNFNELSAGFFNQPKPTEVDTSTFEYSGFVTKGIHERMNKEEELRDKIQQSGVGMHNNRTRYIHKFAMEYWQSPREYVNKSKKDWVKFRNSLAEKTLGLGPAKTSFSIELCHPNSAHITCLDTHLFQVYKLDQSKDLKMYEKIESHWLDMSRMWNVPPYIARCIYWDKKQNKLDLIYIFYIIIYDR